MLTARHGAGNFRLRELLEALSFGRSRPRRSRVLAHGRENATISHEQRGRAEDPKDAGLVGSGKDRKNVIATRKIVELDNIERRMSEIDTRSHWSLFKVRTSAQS